MSKKLSNKSKRTSTRQRVKQQKKLREHQRKTRKEKKLNPGKFKKSKKDPGVPAECPFKDEVLKECADARARREELKEKKREEMKKRREDARAQALENKRTGGLDGLVRDAQQKQATHEGIQNFKEATAKHGVTDKSAKAYYREFVKVVEAADVILQILDARDPMGTRCKEVEDTVLNGAIRKRLVLVLNKADLVPKENIEKWLKYLRTSFPTIAFKASTQTQGTKLGQSGFSIKKSTESQMQTSKCIGASTLTALLANYCRNKDVKTTIRVGVVGLPNVGKSSLINSLKRSKACGVGAVPGFTRVMQEVQLDKKVKLLDSPGMVLASGNMTDSGVALRNALKVDSLDDPVTPVEAILQRCPKQQMMLQYGIADYDGTVEFLSLVARSIGKLKKGGVPDQVMAARLILNDWNSGKIKYYTHPPEDGSPAGNLSSEIVTEFAKEFQLDDLDKMESDDFNELPIILPSQTMAVGSSGILQEAIKNEDKMEKSSSDEDEEEENAGQLSNKISISSNKSKSKREVSPAPQFQAEGLNRYKKLQKVRQKKEKKEARRRDRVAADLSHGMEAAFNTL